MKRALGELGHERGRPRAMRPACVLALSLAGLMAACDGGRQQEPLTRADTMYWTSGPLEPDKIASGWVIQRHICPGASVRFLPADSVASGGIAFDTPSARWARRAAIPTFDVIISDLPAPDRALGEISHLVRVGELQYWSLEPGSAPDLFDLRMKAFARDKDITGAFQFLDSLYHAAEDSE